ncbi:penicillin-binding protein 2 [Patescibacteria group bacterium]|nr:penicillin-binding protein 2 [Patescibacteria group bacterium]MCL5410099.1 penicillin-binding protein 2 [Patescibacteria group bacterium]
MRLKILKVAYFVILFVIVVRLFYWQVLRFDDLAALADEQHLKSSTVEAPRGQIYASDGAILATNKPTFLLYGEPKVVENINQISEQLAKIIYPLSLTPDQTADPVQLNALTDQYKQDLTKDLYWVPLARDLSADTKTKIDQLNLTGVGFDNELSRFYPESSSAAHILGFVGKDSSGQQTGYFGIEGYYNGDLKGIPGITTEEQDANGRTILSGTYDEKEPRPGHDLTLNLDRTVQYFVEKRLKLAMEKYGAKSASAVVMDPKTGAILAMASFPNYDPNNYYDFSKDAYKNPIVADSYEPGSTFKVLMMAAAINEGEVTADTRCDICDGPVKIGSYYIRTWNDQYLGDLTMDQVIIHSDNTGMVFVSRKLGLDKQYQYIQNFGFGNLTNIDLQDEMSPEIRPKEQWHEIDQATASFGQGIAVTPIQLVRAVSAIANGGYLMEPHIVHSIDVDGQVRIIQPKVIRQVISNQTAQTVTQMMVDAVNLGEAKSFAPQGYKIAGKTGTAQIPVAGHYDPTKTIASFVGFAPADSPRFAMLVVFQEPSASEWGAETAAPTFFDIAKDLFTYYNIPPQM